LIFLTSAALICTKNKNTAICWRWPARHYTNQMVNSLLCWIFSFEPSFSCFERQHTFSDYC